MTTQDDLVERLRGARWEFNGELCAEAASLISSLVAENERLRYEHDEVARFVRRRIPEDQNKDQADSFFSWIGMIYSLDARASEAERLLAEARAGLTQIAADLQSSIDTHEFNSRHMIAEDSLQDAWKMLDMAREQFQVDANSLRIPLAKARASIGGGNG